MAPKRALDQDQTPLQKKYNDACDDLGKVIESMNPPGKFPSDPINETDWIAETNRIDTAHEFDLLLINARAHFDEIENMDVSSISDDPRIVKKLVAALAKKEICLEAIISEIEKIREGFSLREAFTEYAYDQKNELYTAVTSYFPDMDYDEYDEKIEQVDTMLTEYANALIPAGINMTNAGIDPETVYAFYDNAMLVFVKSHWEIEE